MARGSAGDRSVDAYSKKDEFRGCLRAGGRPWPGRTTPLAGPTLNPCSPACPSEAKLRCEHANNILAKQRHLNLPVADGAFAPAPADVTAS